MGDSGSLTLGFALGTISLLSVTRIAGLTTIIVPLVIAGIPIIDTFSAIVRRARAHVRVDQADRGHIHHRLIAAGYDQRQAVLVVYVWTALLCLGSLVMEQASCLSRVLVGMEAMRSEDMGDAGVCESRRFHISTTCA